MLRIVDPSWSKAPVHLLGLSSTCQHGSLSPSAGSGQHNALVPAGFGSGAMPRLSPRGAAGKWSSVAELVNATSHARAIVLRWHSALQTSASISGLLKGSCTQQPACFSPNYFSRSKKRHYLPPQTLPPLFSEEKIEDEKERRRKVSAPVPSRLNAPLHGYRRGLEENRRRLLSSDGGGTEHWVPPSYVVWG